MTFLDRLARAVSDAGNPLCVGIDPSPALLATWGLPDDARGARELGMRTVDACRGRVAVVKPQVAYFERHGATGFAALEEVLAAARATGLLTIADAKRGDIGSTNDGYADAWLRPGSPLEADAVTASPYLGAAALAPLFERAGEHEKAVFVLVATSNPEAAASQRAVRRDGTSVADGMLGEARRVASPGTVGAVLGATVAIADYGIDRAALEGIPVLAPGFGAQGARLPDVRTLYGDATVLPSVSRSVLSAGADGIAGAIEAHLDELRAGVS